MYIYIYMLTGEHFLLLCCFYMLTFQLVNSEKSEAMEALSTLNEASGHAADPVGFAVGFHGFHGKSRMGIPYE